MNLSPIIVFVYNRPHHTKQTIEALQKNELAKDSELYIYSDGAKSESDKPKVNEVRKYLKNIDGFKAVQIIEREKNYGLADNIISGVTEIVNKYGTVIVLEDDIVTSPYFLKYMNEALEFYKDEDRVMHISAWSYPAFSEQNGETFFWRIMNCWGWGTWDKAWEHFEKNPKKLIEAFSEEDIYYFNLDGVMSRWKQVVDNHSGRLDTWAIFWQASIISQNGLCISVKYPIVKHFGAGEDSTHVKSIPSFLKHDINEADNFVFGGCIAEDSRLLELIKSYWKNHSGQK